MEYPHKKATSDYPILEPILDRWSPLAFSDQPVEEDKIKTLFEAARWAPSSYNEQPWRFIYATKDDGEDRAKMESLLAEGNGWAKNAYILLIDFGKKNFSFNDKPNRHGVYDTGCAAGYLFLQLKSLGLIGHQMAGFDNEKANAVLGVPDDFEPGAMMAIGYPGDHNALSEDLKKREESPRQRKAQGEFVFRGKWQG